MQLVARNTWARGYHISFGNSRSKKIRGSHKSLQKSWKTRARGVDHGKGKEKEI